MSGLLIKIDVDGTRIEEVWGKRGPPNWETLKRLVGGYIELVQVRYEGRLRDAYVNEDGLSERLQYNPHATALLGGRFEGTGTTIVGPLVIWVPLASAKRKPPKRAT